MAFVIWVAVYWEIISYFFPETIAATAMFGAVYLFAAGVAVLRQCVALHSKFSQLWTVPLADWRHDNERYWRGVMVLLGVLLGQLMVAFSAWLALTFSTH